MVQMFWSLSVFHLWVVCLSFLFLVVTCKIHGGTFLAMAGKDSVVLVSDSRFSSYSSGQTFLGSHPRKIFRVGSRTMVGCFGIDYHAQVLMESVIRKLVDHSDFEVTPASVTQVISDSLYDNGFSVCPIVVGLNDCSQPFICSMDGLGAQTHSNKFAVLGTATQGLLALCESLYIPDLTPSELAKLAERCFHMAMQRDVKSGSNYRILTLTKDAMYSKDINNLDT